MLHGWFKRSTGQPYVEGFVVFPRLGVMGSVRFLVDTGADRTALMPDDCDYIGVSYETLHAEARSVGVGGAMRHFNEPTVIMFDEPGRRVFQYENRTIIAEPNPQTKNLPSLLGRDILDRWRMVYDKPNGKLTFTPRSADRIVRL